ncbi:MAG TPA: hypothetical protein V6D23_20770, partial [Candidatus Obscuribacterales bacterium]
IFAEIDHHVAEVLCLAGLLYHLLRCLETGEFKPHGRWAAAWILGMFLCWNGSVLHVGLLAAVWLLWGLRRPKDLVLGSKVFGLAGLVLIPFYCFGGDVWNLGLDYLHPSQFHPATLLAMGLSFSLAAGWGLERRIRWPQLVALLGLMGLVAAEALKGADLLYGSGGGFPYARVVAELQPLLDLPPAQLLQTFSWPGLLALPGTAAMAVQGWRQRRVEWFLPAMLLLIFGLQTLNNQRFLYMVCLLLPLSLVWLAWILLQTRGQSLSPALQRAVFAAVPLAVAASVWPLDLAALRAYPTVAAPLLETAHWIRERTPLAGDPLHPHRLPEYSLLAPWDMGHMLLYEAERPVVSENFGLNSEVPTRFALAQTEAEGLRLLQQHHARYLLLSGNLIFQPQADLKLLKVPEGSWLQVQSFSQGSESYLTAFPLARFAASLYARLFLLDGSDWPQLQSQGLDGLRLVYEAPDTLPIHVFPNDQSRYFLVLQPDFPPQNQPLISQPARYKLFERVPGARLALKLPGADPDGVLLECPVLTNSGRHFFYRRQLRPDATGRIAGRIPYARLQGKGTTGLDGPCQLQLPEGSLGFEVPAAAVLQGQTLKLPR